MYEMQNELKRLEELREFNNRLEHIGLNDIDKIDEIYSIAMKEIEYGRFVSLIHAAVKYEESYDLYMRYYRNKFLKNSKLWLEVSDPYFLALERKEKIEKLNEENG